MTAMTMSPGVTSPFHRTASPGDDTATRSLASQEKRTFKDKLSQAIQEAQEAEVRALRAAQLQDRKSLALTLLVDGKPQAFVDFFSLTHVAPDSQAGGKPGPGEAEGKLPQDALIALRDQLALAEEAARAGNVQEVYAAQKQLAKQFVQMGRLRTAVFFFKQCLSTSVAAGWLPGELEAHLALGVVHEQLGDAGAAIACHERRLDLASAHNLQAEMDTAFHSLTKVYQGQAQERQSAGDVTGALDAYSRCLRAAERAGDVQAGARANHSMGMLCFGQEKWQDAMFYLRRFIEASSSNVLPDMTPAEEGRAYTAYAQCLEETGDLQGAVGWLEDYLHAVSRGADPVGPAYASCSLGTLYYAQGQLSQAVTYFERFFELARALPDRRVVEVARVNLGMARGALRMQAYMEMVATDLPKLLAWKSALVPFTTDC